MRRSLAITLSLLLSLMLITIPLTPVDAARIPPSQKSRASRRAKKTANRTRASKEANPETTSHADQEKHGLNNEEREREKRQKELLDEHKDSTGQVRSDLWRKGVEHARRMKIGAGIRLSKPSKKPGEKGGVSTLSAPSAGGVVGVQWTQIGPAPLRIDKEQNFQGAGPDSGEVLDIAIDPRNATDRVIYIATNDGGIWKSTDGGASWKPKTDFMSSLSMGAVELDPGNPSIVYAGTGNLFDGAGLFSKGVGIYKSIDAGETWAIVGAAALSGIGINRIAMPSAGVLLVATGNGLFRSIDGGANFGNNSPQFNNNLPITGGFITDLALDTATSSTIYAAVQGQGILVSTDSGATFPAGSNLFSNPGAPTAGTYARISFTQSTNPDSQTIYASVQSTAGTPRYSGLFKSTNTGGSWTTMADAANRAAENGSGNGCQCGYDLTVGVDPVDANRVFIGFQELYLSTDGGANFGTPAASRNLIHWDHHAITFSPASHRTVGDTTTRIYAGTDGGIHYSDDGGPTWTSINEGIGTNLFFSMDMGRGSAANNEYTYGGTQDTGTLVRRPEFADNDWHLAVDGDGGQIAVDPNNALRAYGTDNGGYMITTDGGANWSFPGGTGLPAGVGFLAVDPNSSSVVYATSGAQLFQSTDTGATFTSIKTFAANITAIANVAIDSNTFWVALTGGTVQHSANVLSAASSTWTSNSVTGAPGGSVRGIAIDQTNTDQVAVIYAGFTGINAANRTKHVFSTLNNGTSWADISGTDGGDLLSNLPDLPLHSVVIDPDTSPHTIIVASDAGVMRSADQGATWQLLGFGLPTVYSSSLQIDTSATPSILRVGTYGRSVFELTAASGPLLAVNANLAFENVCAGQTETRTLQLFNVGSSDLHISSIIRASGSTDFKIISGPATPVTIPPGSELDFTVSYKPSGSGNQTAVFQINSDDPNQPARQVFASGTGTAPAIATIIADSGSFGDVCIGAFKDLGLTINNSGTCDLSISGISSSSTSFVVSGVSSFPLVIHPGDSLEVPIRFQPTSGGAKSGQITITHNAGANKQINVSGNGSLPDIKVTGSTDFGEVCAGNLAEKTVTVCDIGACPLNITGAGFVTPTSDFVLVNNPFATATPGSPVVLNPSACAGIVIRFTPTSVGTKTATLRITSNDPDQPTINLLVTATTPAPIVSVGPDLSFPPTVLQSVGACNSKRPFAITNTGSCPAKITAITIGGANSGDYSLLGVTPFPIVLEPGHSVGEGDLWVLFAPLGQSVDRARLGSLSVTYVSDPILYASNPNTGTTTIPARAMCGESVRTGARVLVTAGNVPVPKVEKLQIQRITGNRNRPIVDTVEAAQNLLLQTVNQSAPCGSFKYHREYGGASNKIQLLPGSYTVTATAVVNGKRMTKTVAFDVSTCDFNASIVINF